MLNTETSLGTMWSNLPWFGWHMVGAPFPPFAAPYLSMDPMTKANVVVTQFAQQVHKVSNSWILNSLWNMDTWLYNHHRLSSCLWGFINNAAHCEEAIQGGVFPQSFTHFFGCIQPLFKGFKYFSNISPDADITQWLVLLIGLIYLAFRDKVGMSWVTTLVSTPDTGTDPAPLPISEINHPDWMGVWEETGRVLREYSSPAAGKPSLSLPQREEVGWCSHGTHRHYSSPSSS